jgi:hypothetical protein
MTDRGKGSRVGAGTKTVLVALMAVWLVLKPPAQQGAVSPKRPPQSTSSPEKKAPPRQAYVGDEACRSCHAEEARNYAQTAHHLTSSLPSAKTVVGSFTPDANILHTSNPYLYFAMNVTKEGYFQTAVEELAPSKTVSRTERIAVVTGVPRKGQTYLFWKGDELFQLPVSYWTGLNGWGNSPGYPDGSPRFDKPIIPRCLECHSSYFEWLPPPVNRFKKTSLVLGITCERCHGPGREHVGRHSSKPPLHPGGASEAIINPASLSRDRQIDVCALCHAGPGTPIEPSLSFVAGDVLDDYVYIPYSGADASIDVHASQVQLLRRSRCFQASGTMTCSTCHNVHTPQREAAGFSPRCLTCHQPKDCGLYPKRGDQIAVDCVDCHMPLQETQVIFSNSNGKTLKPQVRTHRIGIYPDAQQP